MHDENYQWAGITCNGDAKLILEGENNVKGFYWIYPGVYIAPEKTLTIDGTGSLNASSLGGAGIGGGNQINCGNITINSGTITATGGYMAENGLDVSLKNRRSVSVIYYAPIK